MICKQCDGTGEQVTGGMCDPCFGWGYGKNKPGEIPDPPSAADAKALAKVNAAKAK